MGATNRQGYNPLAQESVRDLVGIAAGCIDDDYYDRAYLDTIAAEIERRIAEAREQGKMEIVRSL